MDAVKMIKRKADETVRHVPLFVHRWRKTVKMTTRGEDSLSRHCSHPDLIVPCNQSTPSCKPSPFSASVAL